MTGSSPSVTKAEKGTIRCAIYTRKSTDEGLDREFNSLDAQRESAEAYIASQQHEGWACLPDRYDDGGYTGGNMDRPALQRLLEDTAAGKIDCIVVYKVDRLSRSLMDFSRLVELFDQHGVSFVSVTQQFNTTHSMGRLTLNILLSFAQFEREIISERTRDKMAATRRKGKWSGGHPVLGYDVVDRKLVINAAEAACVRQIFQLYLEHQSLISTIQELNRRGWKTKRWTIKKGGESGGRPFDKGNLHGLLTNVLYIGQVRYKDEVHPGEHARHRGPGPVRTGADAAPGQRANRRDRLAEPVRGAAHRSLALCPVQLQHAPYAYREKKHAVSVLRLPARPKAGLECLSVAVRARRRDRTVRDRPDSGPGKGHGIACRSDL